LILRFNIDLQTVKEGPITRQQILSILPKIWVLNNDFIKHDEMARLADLDDEVEQGEVTLAGRGRGIERGIGQENVDQDHLLDPDDPHRDYLSSLQPLLIDHNSNLYNSKHPTEREEDLMEILTHLIPSRKQFSEYYRLDLLLDDYLQHTHHFNQHPDVLHGGGSTSTSLISKMPNFSCFKLLLIPHRVRVDLIALLTASILFSVPRALFQETMEHLLIVSSLLSHDEIVDLISLPDYVKTAIIALSHRICSKELQEYELNGYLSHKPAPPPPVSSSSSSLPPRDSNGFRFLSSLRGYLSSPIERSRPADPLSVPFNEMEIDLLKYLPKIPTVASCPLPSSAAYRDWVSLTARHTIILMSRSSNCPSLTRPQRSVSHEGVLKQLKPLLVAAEMTYEDLEITTTGPALDGRTTVNSKVLSFGSGVPDGRASGLKWNASGATREYQRPWIPNKSSVPRNETVAHSAPTVSFLP
jgi:hypothetical protein